MNPSTVSEQSNPFEITYSSSINKSFFVNTQEINPLVDSRVFLKEDSISNGQRPKKPKKKVKNLNKELKNWLNVSMIKLNQKN